MRATHEKEFMMEMDPGILRAVYRGRKSDRNRFFQNVQSQFGMHGFNSGAHRQDSVTISRIFTATNTLQSNLYWQNPRKIAVANQGSDPRSAVLMSAVQNHYMNLSDEHGNTQKQENQEAIMNAWFFGTGWKKLGYQVVTETKSKQPEDKNDGTIQPSPGSILGIPPDQVEQSGLPEPVRYERLVNQSVSPMDVFLDHKGDCRNFRVITHRMERTLHDILDFPAYDKGVLQSMKEKFEVDKGSRFDTREVELTIYEMMIQNRNGVWILTYAEEFNEPLRYDKAVTQGRIPWSPIIFTNEPGVRYPISHLRVASGIQAWIDRIANLSLEIVGKQRTQHIVNHQALEKGEFENFKKNLVGGVIKAARTLASGDVVELSSKGLNNDFFNFMKVFVDNETEILGVDQQRITGKSSNRTLGQDQLAAIGTQIREGGMLDKVRDWVLHQSKLEAEILKQYSNAPLHLLINKKDFADPQTGQLIEEKWVEFGTPNQPFPLRQFIQGEFDFRINIHEAVKPNRKEIQREAMEAMQVLSNPILRQAAIQDGVLGRMGPLLEMWARSFEIIDSEQFIERLDTQQQSALMALQAVQQAGGVVPEQPMPQEQQVALETESKIAQEQAKPQTKG